MQVIKTDFAGFKTGGCLFHSDESSYLEPVARTPLWLKLPTDAVAAQEHITLYVSIIEAKVIALRSGQDVQPMSNASRWGLKRACMDPRTLDDWTLDTIVSACWIERIAEIIVWEHWSPVRAVVMFVLVHIHEQWRETWLFGLYRRL